MKTWSILLSFLVLLLSIVPCSAFESNSKCTLEKKCEKESHKCGNDCTGKCSPFYTCGSCVGFAMITATVAKAQKKLSINGNKTPDIAVITVKNSSFNGAIWQPPKVSFYL